MHLVNKVRSASRRVAPPYLLLLSSGPEPRRPAMYVPRATYLWMTLRFEQPKHSLTHSRHFRNEARCTTDETKQNNLRIVFCLFVCGQQWQAPWAPAAATAMPTSEMEGRRSGLEVYLSALSGLKESWRSMIVTDVLCAEQETASATMSPATDQVSSDVTS